MSPSQKPANPGAPNGQVCRPTLEEPLCAPRSCQVSEQTCPDFPCFPDSPVRRKLCSPLHAGEPGLKEAGEALLEAAALPPLGGLAWAHNPSVTECVDKGQGSRPPSGQSVPQTRGEPVCEHLPLSIHNNARFQGVDRGLLVPDGCDYLFYDYRLTGLTGGPGFPRKVLLHVPRSVGTQ